MALWLHYQASGRRARGPGSLVLPLRFLLSPATLFAIGTRLYPTPNWNSGRVAGSNLGFPPGHGTCQLDTNLSPHSVPHFP